MYPIHLANLHFTVLNVFFFCLYMQMLMNVGMTMETVVKFVSITSRDITVSVSREMCSIQMDSLVSQIQTVLVRMAILPVNVSLDTLT